MGVYEWDTPWSDTLTAYKGVTLEARHPQKGEKPMRIENVRVSQVSADGLSVSVYGQNQEFHSNNWKILT
jgi:hypothetical protein